MRIFIVIAKWSLIRDGSSKKEKPGNWDSYKKAKGEGGLPRPLEALGSRCSEMDSRTFMTLIKAQKAPIFLYKFEVNWLESLRRVTC